MAQEDQRRSMVRMDDVIEISHRPVADQEIESFGHQIITRSASQSALESVANIIQAAGKAIDPNAPTWRAISLLDKKLDYLISLLLSQAPAKTEEAEFYRAEVNISGSGIRFPSQHLYKKGAHLWIAMIIPASPSFRVEAIGRVERLSSSIKRRDKAPSAEVGARFVAINPQDSEEILRYIFQKQREMLRAKQRDA